MSWIPFLSKELTDLKYVYRALILLLIPLMLGYPGYSNAEGAKEGLSGEQKQAIEQRIVKQMKAGKIPGLSVVLVEGDRTVYQKSFGVASKETGLPVNSKTLFELGSTSKAFTGLGILYLEEEGLLNLNDQVDKYIPWFYMNYKGLPVHITVAQLLHQTSGIPYRTIGDIEAYSGQDALERTVRRLSGGELDYKPGERFQYATVNYDVLGYIIEQVSGQTYEEFMTSRILSPLGLKHTYSSRAEAYALPMMADGHKLSFLSQRTYDAPAYKGNAPAGYIVMNAEDMATWLKIQSRAVKLESPYRELIDKSHEADRTVAPGADGSSYAAGWQVFQKGSGQLSHAGSNPNFSSNIVIKPGEHLGLAVLANSNSDYTGAIVSDILSILEGKELKGASGDMMLSLDRISSALIVLSGILGVLSLGYLIMFVYECIQHKRKAASWSTGNLARSAVTLLFLGGLGYCLYLLPDVLFDRVPWSFVHVWAPYSLMPAMLTLFGAMSVFLVYFQLIRWFPKENDKLMFPLIVLSFVSGFGNAFVIFTINTALDRKDALFSGLIVYFLLGLTLYVLGQKLIQTEMVKLTGGLVYAKRTELIHKVLNAPYAKFEQMEDGNIHVGLNNDSETIGRLPGVIISAFTGTATMLCCLVYLGTINFYGLLVSIAIIALAAGLYVAVGRSANRIWERTRDIQNTFFSMIDHLILGFKELSMNKQRRADFQQDMNECCDEYRSKSILASIKFTNAFVIGELLFTFVIGTVAFVFPVIFSNVEVGELRAYIFVFLYMTNPLHAVLDNIPELFRIRVSWRRIQALIEEIPSAEPETLPSHAEPVQAGRYLNGNFEISLQDVTYVYEGNNGMRDFNVGPLTLSFRSGEITFITGGNGSGKTTLAKLLTGLYEPFGGQLTLNGRKVASSELRELYSTVFSDFHLFRTMYGINYNSCEEDIEKYLQLLGLSEKIKVDQGRFDHLNLSTGQKKRVALMISYLEDKDIFLFDEWAADQDPEFKQYFYRTLLPELRVRNKCIIAITHDDHYYDAADKVYKLTMGKVDTYQYRNNREAVFIGD